VIIVGTVFAVAYPAAAAHRPRLALDQIVLPSLGAGYAVTSQGPLDASAFAASSPDPTAAAGALTTLAQQIESYQRTWQDAAGTNEVQDLLVRFTTTAGAEAFLRAAQHSLDSGEIVSAGPLPGVPGARRTTYFASTSQAGIGQAITMRAGVYVALLSFFSGATGNRQPITPSAAERVAKAQRAAMAAAPGGTVRAAPAKPGASLSGLTWTALAVLVLGAAVATPALLRRRQASRTGAGLVRSDEKGLAEQLGQPHGEDG
jgi:hypothetical protein